MTHIDRRIEWWQLTPGSVQAYAVAAFLIVVAGGARWGLGQLTNNLQAFTTFYPAILLATLIGGAGVGIFAAIVSTSASWLFFLPPIGSLFPLTLGDEINLLTFLIVSLLIVWAVDHYRNIAQRLKDEERFRKLAVEELAHRLKNKLATIQAIISFRLREQPDARQEIIGALTALTATDDLIIASQGQGARIGDVFSTELAAYDLSRITMFGPECFLAPKLALTIALVVHELATNAAKYGALSRATGKLSVTWSVSGRRLEIEWRERDGPAVSQPSHGGFGTRLFHRVLEEFDGSINTSFEPTGLFCGMRLLLPDAPPRDSKSMSGVAPKVFASD